jgi:mRNA interferase MazF
MTSNLRWAEAPGNVQLSAAATGLPRESVANVTQILTVDRGILTERVGKIPGAKVDLILAGMDLVFDRG